MSGFLQFLGGLLIIAAGMSLVIKTEWMYSMFGSIPWADEHLGFEGGSRLFYKLLGVIICFFGILTAFGLFRGFFVSTAGQLLLPQSARDAAQ
jgi:hypothetical protein